MVAAARGLEEQPEEELESASESNEEEDDNASVISVAATNNGDRTKPLGCGSLSQKIGRNHQQFLGSRDTTIELCVTALAISDKGRGARGGSMKKTSTTVFITNIYSNLRHEKQKFKTLFHLIKSATSQAQKDLAKRGDAAVIICGDFNSQHRNSATRPPRPKKGTFSEAPAKLSSRY
ncbi:hypothetical protein MRX96_023490 [Rhipicephalus microplus]